MVNLGGRPREYDLDKEAADLIEWAKDPNNFILRKFFLDRGYVQSTAIRFTHEHKGFCEAYEFARESIGQNREHLAATGAIKEGVYNRYAGLYDQKLREYDREEKAYDASVRADANKDSGNVFNIYPAGTVPAEPKPTI